ncbi:MAG: tetratricopeptide repeat protein, partial [Planktothrix sp.]
MEAAGQSYNLALGLEPNDPYIWNNRGNVLSDLGRLEEA